MVRLVLLLFFIHFFIRSAGQQGISDKKLMLSASFNKDSVFMGDSLKITVFYKNNSKYTLKFYSEGRVVLMHYSDLFINYETDRIVYILREYTNRNNIVWLSPGEEITETFNIKAISSFFYEGENIIKICYRNLWDDPVRYKKRQKSLEQDSMLLLYLPSIHIIVSNQK
jgi:hypothetical protein